MVSPVLLVQGEESVNRRRDPATLQVQEANLEPHWPCEVSIHQGRLVSSRR